MRLSQRAAGLTDHAAMTLTLSTRARDYADQRSGSDSTP